MSKTIRYSDEPISEFKIVTDFLPSPEELSLKNENTKITISLSSESVAYFKTLPKSTTCNIKKLSGNYLTSMWPIKNAANKRMQTDKHARYARMLAADSRR